jgi:uncharacterized protein (DUF433 family)
MSEATIMDIGGLIQCSPGIKHGSPHIAGTGVLVRTIARWSQSGLLAEEITAKYGFLRLHQVHAALAHYYANQEAVDAELDRMDQEAMRLELEAGVSPPCAGDFLARGEDHSGMVLIRQQTLGIGEKLRRLIRLASVRSAEDMRNRIEFLSGW